MEIDQYLNLLNDKIEYLEFCKSELRLSISQEHELESLIRERIILTTWGSDCVH